MSELTDEQAKELGDKLIDILGLKVKRNGRVDTNWGDKTPEGLARTVQRILEEHGASLVEE
jgi:hypothetical protein